MRFSNFQIGNPPLLMYFEVSQIIGDGGNLSHFHMIGDSMNWNNPKNRHLYIVMSCLNVSQLQKGMWLVNFKVQIK